MDKDLMKCTTEREVEVYDPNETYPRIMGTDNFYEGVKHLLPTPRGGARKGAGRKPGSGRYGEKTVPVRVPARLVSTVDSFVQQVLDYEKADRTMGYKVLRWKLHLDMVRVDDEAEKAFTTPQEAPQEDGHQAETGTPCT